MELTNAHAHTVHRTALLMKISNNGVRNSRLYIHFVIWKPRQRNKTKMNTERNLKKREKKTSKISFENFFCIEKWNNVLLNTKMHADTSRYNGTLYIFIYFVSIEVFSPFVLVRMSVLGRLAVMCVIIFCYRWYSNK